MDQYISIHIINSQLHPAPPSHDTKRHLAQLVSSHGQLLQRPAPGRGHRRMNPPVAVEATGETVQGHGPRALGTWASFWPGRPMETQQKYTKIFPECITWWFDVNFKFSMDYQMVFFSSDPNLDLLSWHPQKNIPTNDGVSNLQNWTIKNTPQTNPGKSGWLTAAIVRWCIDFL